MADIKRNNPLVHMNSKLQEQHNEILINEKRSQINTLKQKLKDLVDVEEKKLILQIDMLNEAIKMIEKNQPIDVECDLEKNQKEEVD